MNQGPRYMLQRLVPKHRYNKLTEPEKYGSGPIGLLKNLWGEVRGTSLRITRHQIMASLSRKFPQKAAVQ